MSAKSKNPPANKSASAPTRTPPPAAAPVPAAAIDAAGGVAAVVEPPFYERHPKLANAIFAAVCIYVAMLWLLALDQTFHWGIFGPKLPLTP